MWGDPPTLVMVVFFKYINIYIVSIYIAPTTVHLRMFCFFFGWGLIPGCLFEHFHFANFWGAVPLLVLCFQEPELTLKRISALVTSVLGRWRWPTKPTRPPQRSSNRWSICQQKCPWRQKKHLPGDFSSHDQTLSPDRWRSHIATFEFGSRFNSQGAKKVTSNQQNCQVAPCLLSGQRWATFANILPNWHRLWWMQAGTTGQVRLVMMGLRVRGI